MVALGVISGYRAIAHFARNKNGYHFPYGCPSMFILLKFRFLNYLGSKSWIQLKGQLSECRMTPMLDDFPDNVLLPGGH